MPFTKFTNLDFDQIRQSIKDYLRANSTFTDFDFEGSNFSVLIDTLAYNTYITAFNSNMIVNESFLDSATLRENIVSLSRNIGYVPRSKTSAIANISFNINLPNPVQLPTQIILKAGLVAVGSVENSSYVFSIPEATKTVVLAASVPPNSITAFLAFDIVASVINKVVLVDVIAMFSKPTMACCTKFKFVFVFVPHVPEFSPVAISSIFKSVENVDAIKIPL